MKRGMKSFGISLTTLCAILAFAFVPSASAVSKIIRNHNLGNGCMITAGSSYGDGVGNAWTQNYRGCVELSVYFRHYDTSSKLHWNDVKTGSEWVEYSKTNVKNITFSEHGGFNVGWKYKALYY